MTSGCILIIDLEIYMAIDEISSSANWSMIRS